MRWQSVGRQAHFESFSPPPVQLFSSRLYKLLGGRHPEQIENAPEYDAAHAQPAGATGR